MGPLRAGARIQRVTRRNNDLCIADPWSTTSGARAPFVTASVALRHAGVPSMAARARRIAGPRPRGDRRLRRGNVSLQVTLRAAPEDRAGPAFVCSARRRPADLADEERPAPGTHRVPSVRSIRPGAECQLVYADLPSLIHATARSARAATVGSGARTRVFARLKLGCRSEKEARDHSALFRTFPLRLRRRRCVMRTQVE
ncbi:hypothetical protein MRX96_015949 [Rhipicephalus microplus]